MKISEIHIQPELEKAIDELGFTELTEIQRRVIPVIQEGNDVIGQSHTGSGKTAAFGLPILERIIHNNGLQVLILVPTRELCEQVTKEMNKFAKYKKMSIIAVYGGVSIGPQFDRLRFADIVVGTPGRILDHINRKTIILNKIKILVLDEADKMFEMGFVDDVNNIISNTPRQRQTLLFSATISQDVHNIVKKYMNNAVKIKLQEHVDKNKLIQYYYQVEAKDKFSLLAHLLKQEATGLTLVFCATRSRVDIINRNLNREKIISQAIHGGLSQNRRKKVMELFHNKKIDVLVASDVAARGLDIKNVKHVINYDIPKTSKEYIHRIGRTARAGEEGKVISLLADADHDNFRRVLEDRTIKVEKLKLPEFERLKYHHVSRSSFEEKRPFHGRNNYNGNRGYIRRDNDKRHGFNRHIRRNK